MSRTACDRKARPSRDSRREMFLPAASSTEERERRRQVRKITEPQLCRGSVHVLRNDYLEKVAVMVP